MLLKDPGDISGPVTECSASPCSAAVSVKPAPRGAPSRGNGGRKASIALIDEFPLRRAGTLNLLRRHFREAVLQFASVADFLTHASTCADAPSAVVMCIGRHSMTDTPLPEHLHLIGGAVPAPPIIVLSNRDEPEEVVAAFRKGVQGYIPTSLAPRLVVHAIRIVLAGGTFFPADALVRARRLLRPEIECAPRTDQVTSEHREQWPPRQLAVLGLLAQGKANKEIALTLGIEEGTVKVHLRQIMRKLGVTNRTQVAIATRQLGIPAAPEITRATIASGPDTAGLDDWRVASP